MVAVNKRVSKYIKLLTSTGPPVELHSHGILGVSVCSSKQSFVNEIRMQLNQSKLTI